jgi:hypothetical protein
MSKDYYKSRIEVSSSVSASRGLLSHDTIASMTLTDQMQGAVVIPLTHSLGLVDNHYVVAEYKLMANLKTRYNRPGPTVSTT